MKTTQTNKRRFGEKRDQGSLRPTIAHVAEASGVAKTTVSAILNDRPHCYASEKTRKRVKSAAERLNYRPTPSARGLLGLKTGTVGLVSPGVDSEPLARRIFGFEDAARQAGRIPLIINMQNESASEDDALRRLIDHYVDGIVLYPLEQGPHTELVRLAELGFPVVTMDGGDRLGLDLPISDVSIDYFRAGVLQAEHLIEIGRQRIGMLRAQQRCFVNDRKMDGFRAGLETAGVELAADIEVALPQQTSRHWLVDDFEKLRDVLSDAVKRVDAVATFGDPVGLATIRYATELGIHVPDDLAIIAMGGSSVTALGAIPMSTIEHSSEDGGRLAFELLAEQIDHSDDPPPPRRIQTPVQLIARTSTIGRRYGMPR